MVFNIAISDDQLEMIAKALIAGLQNPNVKFTDDEREEIDIIVDMIGDTLESGDEETIHGFCY